MIRTERRKADRWRSAGMTASLVGGSASSVAEASDASSSGFRLKADWDYPVGSYVTVRITFPHGERTDVEAKVAWRKKIGTNGSAAQEMGFILTAEEDNGLFKEALGLLDKTPAGDRRKTDRRKEPVVGGPERRSHDRRAGAPMRVRTDRTGSDLDRWISIHTYGRVLQSSSAASVVTRDQRKIMLGANNYLGLTDHPAVKEAAIKAIEKYGTGAGGVRVLSGTMDLHKRLEERIAEFKGAEACLLFPAGYVANFAVLGALLKKDDVVLNDEVNHASIVDGCRFTAAVTRFYKHNDLASLERKLAQYDAGRPLLVITDGVFSMDGDVAPLKEIVALARRYGAMVMVDDAHATGVIGARGRGTAEHCGVAGQVDVTVATLSKALGAVGGAVCGSRALIKTVFHHSRQFIFTSALPPSVCASALAALDVIDREPELLRRLHENRRFLWEGLNEMGYQARETPSAVIPVILGDEEKAYLLARRLDELGVFVNAVSPPAVPRGSSRLRVSVMATHTPEQIGAALEAFKRAGKSLGII